MSAKNGSVGIALPSTPVTYIQLKEKFADHLRSVGRHSVVANYNTTLNAFMSVHRRTDASLVGPDFDGDFEELRRGFLDSQKRGGLKPSTYSSRSTHLKAINEFYISIVSPHELPPNFSLALKRLLSSKGYTPCSFHRAFLKEKCSRDSVNAWCNGKITPSTNSLPIIQEIERLLGIEEGTLTNRLPKKLKGTGLRKTGMTPFGGKMINACKKKYGIWTDKLEKEFKELTAFKTTADKPEEVRRRKRGIWTKSVGSNGVQLPTASKTKQLLRLFFGYCCLPKDGDDPQLCGRGMKPEELTLALLANKKIVQGYLKFQRLRAGGKYNGGSIVFLSMVTSLLRPQTGYLYQHPKLFRKLNASMPLAMWHKLCVAVRNRLLDMMSLIKVMKEENHEDDFELGRNPLEPIKDIIDLDRPIYPILRMIESMLYVMLAECAPTVKRAIQFRNILLIALLSANPLRIRQFAIMEFDRHLVRQDDGSWWLQFRKGEFKNRKSLRTHYRVRVEAHIWPLIERYRSEFRPLLAGAESCNYVFRPCATGVHGADNTAPMSTRSFLGLITELTQLYIPGCPGFGPHAFRHIVATDIIKTRPEYGFFLAAKVLHDKLETVEEEYAHLKTSELFEPYNVHYAEAWRTVMPDMLGGAWV